MIKICEYRKDGNLYATLYTSTTKKTAEILLVFEADKRILSEYACASVFDKDEESDKSELEFVRAMSYMFNKLNVQNKKHYASMGVFNETPLTTICALGRVLDATAHLGDINTINPIIELK